METKTNYTVVGVFVIVLVTAIIFSVIWLSSGLSSDHYLVYKVLMKESVSGLNVDSQVEFNGVDVGSVKSIEINKSNPQLVEVLLNVKSATPITLGTTATLNTRGLTGNAYVALVDKGTDTTPLKPSSEFPNPLIKTSPSLFMRLDTALNEITNNIKNVAKSIQILLDAENMQSFKQTLKHLDRVTGTIADNTQQMNAIFVNTSKATQELSALIQSGNATVNSINGAANNLYELSREIKQNPSMIIRGKQPSPLGPGEE